MQNAPNVIALDYWRRQLAAAKLAPADRDVPRVAAQLRVQMTERWGSGWEAALDRD